MNRILHTMLRVGDTQRSVDFYTQVLAMRVLCTCDHPDDCYTLTPRAEKSLLSLTTHRESLRIDRHFNRHFFQERGPITAGGWGRS